MPVNKSFDGQNRVFYYIKLTLPTPLGQLYNDELSFSLDPRLSSGLQLIWVIRKEAGTCKCDIKCLMDSCNGVRLQILKK